MKSREGLLVFFLVIVLALSACQKQVPSPAENISNFAECAAAGYPIMESYPEQCRTKDGRTFVREITPPPEEARVIALAKRFVALTRNVSVEEVTVTELLRREWPNACLGITVEGEVCAQVVTPGFEIIMNAKGMKVTVRTNEDGSVVRESGSVYKSCDFDMHCPDGFNCRGSSRCPPGVQCVWEGEPGICVKE